MGGEYVYFLVGPKITKNILGVWPWAKKRPIPFEQADGGVWRGNKKKKYEHLLLYTIPR